MIMKSVCKWVFKDVSMMKSSKSVYEYCRHIKQNQFNHTSNTHTCICNLVHALFCTALKATLFMTK